MTPSALRQGQSRAAAKLRKMRHPGALRPAPGAVRSNKREDPAFARIAGEPILRNRKTPGRVSNPGSPCAVKVVGTDPTRLACPLESAEGRDRYVYSIK